MCGILALSGEEVEVSSYLLSHRGPDDYRSETIGKCRMDFYASRSTISLMLVCSHL